MVSPQSTGLIQGTRNVFIIWDDADCSSLTNLRG